VTATRATPSRGQSTSTTNTPPLPESVCSIAFAASSDTHVMRTSRAGQPASSPATNRRASGTDAGTPRKARDQRPRGLLALREPAGRGASAEPEEPTWSTG
jgi:hypothetical protein